MEMRKRKPKVVSSNEIYEYPSFFRKRQESKGRTSRNGRSGRSGKNGGIVEVGEDADDTPDEGHKREDGRVREPPPVDASDKLATDGMDHEMEDFPGSVQYEKNGRRNGRRRRGKSGKHLGDYHSGVPSCAEKKSNIYDDADDVNNYESKLSEVSHDHQEHYSNDSLFDLSSPNEEHEHNSLYTPRNYQSRKKKKKKKTNHAVKGLVVKSKCGKGNRKKLKNALSDRARGFVDEGHSLQYDVDLFHYLSCLSERKNDAHDWKGDQTAHALINLIIDELVKKTYQKKKGKNSPVQTNKQCNNNSDAAIKGYHEENSINIKEKISFETIKNYDETNLRHMFFLENINIDYNGRKVELSPFKSTIIEETAMTKGSRKVSLTKRRKSRTKKESNMRNCDKHGNTSPCTQMERLKVCVERKVDNLQSSQIYLNDHHFPLNSEGIQFLYFLLLCDCLYDGLYENKSQKEQEGGGEDGNSEECTRGNYSQWENQNDVDGALERPDGEDLPSAYINVKKIMTGMEAEMVKMGHEQNIFLSLCAPIVYLDFSSSVNFVDYLKEILDASLANGSTICDNGRVVMPNHKNSGRQEAQKEHDQEDPLLHDLMNDLLKMCAQMFEGNFLAVSTCSYLNSYMFLSSEKRSRNFIFIFFVSPFFSKPLLVDIVEVNHMCKKVEWVKLPWGNGHKKGSGRDSGDSAEKRTAKERRERDLHLLLCLGGNEISIYAIPKRHLLLKLYDSAKNEPTCAEPTEYIKQKIADTKLEKVFSYHDEEGLSDFSYSICVNDNQRFLKIALTFNSTRIKVLSVYLSEISRYAKITRFIEREDTTNACVHTSTDYLLSHFKNPLGDGTGLGKGSNHKGERAPGEEVPLSPEPIHTNEFPQPGQDTHCVAFHEDILHLQQGIISVCSFYPCLNSYLLALSSKEGEMIIIDIRNNNELYFCKRKTESVTHMRWYENSCLSFGQEKGCIIHLFENKYFLNIDKDWISQVDIICIHSSLLNDMHVFLFDDGTVVRGKLKGNLSKANISELFVWKTPNFELDPEVLLNISEEKGDETESVSRILLYEYLQGLQSIFRNGVKIGKSKAVEANAREKTIALTPKCVSIANLGQKYLIAYGNGSGLIHVCSREKELDAKSVG
ncbi:hypothetical protein AK88_02803 [Plasmodium fragile]|uniref:Uncharacterized protein n=1 Tax=Plasmodium fragile TaxID=5857 RepID=A0A0D9QKE0_PLAFR|nr:uncharacterized protein AK88_02803 [Plasmodium fragile]KJP87499.1 hypothetical protein AK88_02803 [Plasmodium fragile]